MRINRLLAILAALVAAAAPAGAATTDPFRAELHEADVCGRGIDLCGTGVVHGFGTATTTLEFTSFAPGPGKTCVTGTADRAIVIDGDGSTLHLEIAGTICRREDRRDIRDRRRHRRLCGRVGRRHGPGNRDPGVPGGMVHLVGTLTMP